MKRHYVKVNFPNFQNLIATGINSDKASRELTQSPLQISCSCGRWRFWYAYMASRAGYNSGPLEDAFPKIRNSTLSGIACKHILRVMLLIDKSPVTRTYLKNMVDFARTTVVQKRIDEKKSSAQDFVQANRAERAKLIKVSASSKAKQAMKNMVATVAQKVSRRAAGAKDDLNAAIRKAAKLGVLTPAQLAAVAAILKQKG